MPSHCVALAQIHSPATSASLIGNTTAGVSSTGAETTQMPPASTTMIPESPTSSPQTPQLQCLSACTKDSLFNHSPVVAEAPEISFPENVELVESSTAAATKYVQIFTATKVPEMIDNSSMQRNQTIENGHRTTSTNASIETTTSNNNKASAIDGERPIEIRDSSTSIITDPLPTIASAPGTVSIASLLMQPFPIASNSNSVYHMTNEHSASSNEEFKMQKVEPTIVLADTHSTGVLTAVESTVALTAAASNDINGVYNKKIQPSIFESLADELNKNESAEVAPMLTGPAAIPAETDCFSVRVMARADSFNATLGSDDICPHSDGGGHSFNITYNIPVSQYMKENRFDLIFV